MISPISKSSGLYVVSLTNEHPISVNADRPAIAERCIRVTRDNCKFGKANNLQARRANYFRTFGAEYVCFKPVAAVTEPGALEKLIAQKLRPYRILGRTGRPNEWLQGITPLDVEAIILSVLEAQGVAFRHL